MTAERSTRVDRASPRVSRLAVSAVFATVAALVFGSSAPAADAITLQSPARVSFIVPVSVQAGADGFISAEQLESLTASSGYLTRLLDAVVNQPVTLAIDPMVVVSIRILGSDAPSSAVDWLDRLALAGNNSFALSYADSDLTLPLQAGSKTVLEPLSFDFAIDPALFPAGTEDGTETSSPSTDTTVPTTESLLDWDHSHSNVAWPIAGTVTSADLDTLVNSGTETIILSSANVRRTSTVLANAELGSRTVVVTDDAASAILATALEEVDVMGWQRGVSALASSIEETAAPSRSGASIAIAAPRGQLSDPSRLRATISALSANTNIRLVGLGGILSFDQSAATLIESQHPDADIERVSPLLINEAADARFAEVASNPQLITSSRRIDLLATLAPQWNRYAGGWGVATSQFTADSIALRSSVQIVESSEITFAADRGLLPITVENSLDQVATVFVTVRPTTPLLSFENSRFEVEIEPNSQRKALIPAEALSNGTVELVVSLRSGSDYRIGEPTSVTTRVQAGWETPVTLGLGALVVLIFIVGIYRTIRRRRAASEEDAAELTIIERSE